MAEIGYVITSKLIEVLANETILYICKLWNYESKLEQLKQTVSRIQKMFFDADVCWAHLNEQQRGFIRELKDVVCDAEDVFDEFHTRAELNQLGKKSKSKVRKFFGKVRHIFSFDKNQNHVIYANKVAGEVMHIMERLDAIAGDRSKFNLQVDYKSIVHRPKETCSYVDAHRIIGRDMDKKEVISFLLDPNFQNKFCFLSIVGIGGLGKTTLAQLVFNDEKIQQEFPDPTYRLWVCVSDQDREQFDEKVIISKILELITGDKQGDDSLKELVVKQFQQKIRGKKFMLVLDDVWNENRDKWSRLENFLRMGHEGSKIIVTTRSELTACVIDKKHVYRLDGLSLEDSQCLFEVSAFEEGEKNTAFLEIGAKVVGKCHRNPLAIKVVGSLLFGQDIIKWKSIERSGLADIEKGNIDKGNSDKILPILKLSYYNLSPSLKSCFSYCAVFPKDSIMYKEMLLCLWMAQGYIVPLDGGQSVEDAAEEHFSILMHRCFFQDIEKDEYGNVVFVKIHDLMHDVAQEVGKEEICVVPSNIRKSGEKIRHLNTDGEFTEISLHRNKIRSYICGCKDYLLDKQFDKFRTLRVLDLSKLGNFSFPQTIYSLLLLRYLNLGWNTSLQVLPDSITRLYNLQTLVLCYCKNLRKVPTDFSTLINLRHLNLYGCDNLKRMPLGILKLRNLKVLPYYVETDKISNEELDVLKQVFTNLKGQICIKSVDDMRRGYSENMEPLAKLAINKGKWVITEDVLEKLELPPYLNALGFTKYKGKTLPLQAISFQQYLLHIEITFCDNLEQIPVLSKLPRLKSLELMFLHNVEYMENGMNNNGNDNKVADFFPSLESLKIESMNKLKGWWKGDFPGMRLRCPRLLHLEIKMCPNFAANIVCPPCLEQLQLERNSEMLVITGELEKLKEMEINMVNHLKLIPPTNYCLTSLKLTGDIEVERALEHVRSFQSSPKNLTFSFCVNMRRLPRLDHLIALERLELKSNFKLNICEDNEEESWTSLPPSLRKLEFSNLPKMRNLPKGMQHLTSLQSLQLRFLQNMEGGLPEWMSCLSSLQSLKIINCKGIKSLPEAFKDLTSLKKLYVSGCMHLEERCKEPNGEDFPKIQHIPKIDIVSDYINFFINYLQ